MLKLGFLLFILFSFFGCSGQNKNSNDEKAILLNPIEVNKKYSFVDFLHYIEYIPISDQDDYYIRQLGKIIISDDFYFTKLGYKAGSIHQYDQQGNFIQKIYAVDQVLQPRGFDGIGDMVWDPVRKLLYVSDLEYRHIVALDINDMEKGISRVMDDVYGLGLHLHNDVLYILTNDHDTGLIRTFHLNSGIEHHLIKEDNYLVNGGIDWYHFTQAGDHTLLSIPFNDTIYQITPDAANPKYVVGDSTITVRDPGLDMNEYLMNLGNIYESPLNKYRFPSGSIWFIEGKILIDFMNWTSIFIDPKEGQSFLAYMKDELKSLYLFHKNIMIRGICPQSYLYTTVILDEDFYKESQIFLSTHDDTHPLTIPLQQLITEYPPEREFQNPVVVKYKFKANFLDALR